MITPCLEIDLYDYGGGDAPCFRIFKTVDSSGETAYTSMVLAIDLYFLSLTLVCRRQVQGHIITRSDPEFQ